MSSSDSLSGELNSFPSSLEFMNNVVITEPAIEEALRGGAKPGTPVKTTRLSSRNSPFKEEKLMRYNCGIILFFFHLKKLYGV